MNLPRSLRALAIIACAGLLGGCTGYHVSLSDSAAVTPDADEALVIVGYTYTGALRTNPLPLQTGCPVAPVSIPTAQPIMVIEIVRHNPAGSSRITDTYFANRVRCAAVTPDEPVSYNFLHLPPGTYTVTGVISPTSLARRGITFTNSPYFSIAAGEVVYIGDVALASIEGGVSLRRTDEAAKTAFAKRGGAVDRFTFRPLASITPRPVYQ